MTRQTQNAARRTAERRNEWLERVIDAVPLLSTISAEQLAYVIDAPIVSVRAALCELVERGDVVGTKYGYQRSERRGIR